jgi:hypothetical protein
VVELHQAVDRDADIAAGVVQVAKRRVQALHTVLREIDDGVSVTGVQQRGEHVERLLDLAGVPARVAAVVRPVGDPKLCGQVLPQRAKVELAPGRLRLGDERQPERVVSLREREEPRDQLVVRQRLELSPDQVVLGLAHDFDATTACLISARTTWQACWERNGRIFPCKRRWTPEGGYSCRRPCGKR